MKRVLILGPLLISNSRMRPALGSAPGRAVLWLLPVSTGWENGCKTRSHKAEGLGYGDSGASRAGSLFPLAGTACPVTLGHFR